MSKKGPIRTTKVYAEAKRISIKELHTHMSVFVGGKDYGTKIDTQKKGGLAITHFISATRNEIHLVTPEGKSCYFPFTGNVAQATPFDPSDADISQVELKKPEPIKNPEPMTKPKPSAQVWTPHDVVQK